MGVSPHHYGQDGSNSTKHNWFTRSVKVIKNFAYDHYIVFDLLSFLPSIWFIVAPMYPAVFLTKDNKFTTGSTVISCVCVIVMLALNLLRARWDHESIAELKAEDVEKGNSSVVYRQLLNGVNSVVEHKLSFINREVNGRRTLTNDIDCELNQLQILIEELATTLSILFSDISKDNIHIGLAVNSANQKILTKWQWYAKLNIQDSTQLQYFVNQKNSSINHVLKTGIPLIYANKGNAIANKCYVPTPLDKAANCTGSVICTKITTGGCSEFITAVLCISTYYNQLCKENEQELKSIILERIISPFTQRMALELHMINLKRQTKFLHREQIACSILPDNDEPPKHV